MASGLLASFDEQGQADEVDGGSDSERPDIFEYKAHEPGESQDDLKEGRHQDGPLDL